MDAKKAATLAKLKAAFQKKFGKESINYYGDDAPPELKRIPSQCLAIDEVTGGGYPLGRIVEIFGGESSGKTTALYHAIASAQAQYPDRVCGFIDSEQSFDPEYARACGVKVDELMFSQPNNGPEAFGIMQMMIESGFPLIAVDSVAAMVPREESEEEDFGKSQVGRQAAMMSRSLRKILPILGHSECVVIFTNQTRDAVGVLWGDPTTTPGGKALKFYASIRLKFTKLKAIEEGSGDNKQKVGVRTRVEAVKNKTFPPYRRGEFVITFGKGIDDEAAVFQAIIDAGLVGTKAGGWYTLDGQNIARGIPALKEYYAANPAVYDRLKAELKTKTKGASATAEAVIPQDAAAEAEAIATEAAVALEEGEV